jgi:hypothetical protein
MMILPVRIKHPLNVSVQCPHDADASKHRRPACSATSIRLSIAARHSAVSATFFGSAMMYAAAYLSVKSWRPFGSGIGSSNFRDQSAVGMVPFGSFVAPS